MAKQDHPNRRTYSVREAADVLGVGRNAVYELVKAGRLPALRLGAQGKRIVITKDAVERLLAEASVAEEPATYTVAEAAQVLGCGRSAVYELIKSGRLPAERFGPEGNRILIPRDAVEQLLAEVSSRVAGTILAPFLAPNGAIQG